MTPPTSLDEIEKTAESIDPIPSCLVTFLIVLLQVTLVVVIVVYLLE